MDPTPAAPSAAPAAVAPAQDPLLADLSESQRAAVLAQDCHLLLLAGAGSGKTRVITHRIAHLIQRGRVPTHRILAVTFTNKAAREMLGRVGHLLGMPPPANLWIMTFHALGARLLRLHAEAAGLKPGFSIFDESDSERLVKRILRALGIDSSRMSPGGTQTTIALLKSHLASPGTDWHRAGSGRLGALLARADTGPASADLLLKVYAEYERELAEQNAVDFADLIARPVRLLREDAAVRARYHDRFQHLLVDEYQDTDHSQYTLMKLLAGPGARVCAVGDEDQSIYSWRGADIGNILSFKADFPAARVLLLDRNYRCPQPVLAAANAMIRNNTSRLKEREVVSDKPSPWRPSFHEVDNPESEGELIAQAAAWMRVEEGIPYGDQAVFYRTHAQARAIEQALARRGVPYRVFGGLKFYERRAIKDLVCYLRVLANPADREALLRIINVPKRGIGEKGIEKLVAAASAGSRTLLDALDDPKILGGKAGKAGTGLAALFRELRELAGHDTLPGLLRQIAMRIDYHEHLIADDRATDWELVEELDSALVAYAERAAPDASTLDALRGFLEEASLVAAVDALAEGEGTLSLMTLHNAKGLEFPVVFIAGLEEGLLPHENSLYESATLEEERRLFYVGMTRTKRRLFLSRTRARVLHGGYLPRMPSRFLREIGETHLDLGGA